MIELELSESPIPRADTALVLVGSDNAPPGFALVRHAGEAAAVQGGACACCRRPSDLVTVLRRLAIDHARGAVELTRVVVLAGNTLRAEIEADPLLAARYRLVSPPPPPPDRRAPPGGAAGRRTASRRGS